MLDVGYTYRLKLYTMILPKAHVTSSVTTELAARLVLTVNTVPIPLAPHFLVLSAPNSSLLTFIKEVNLCLIPTEMKTNNLRTEEALLTLFLKLHIPHFSNLPNQNLRSVVTGANLAIPCLFLT